MPTATPPGHTETSCHAWSDTHNLSPTAASRTDNPDELTCWLHATRNITHTARRLPTTTVVTQTEAFLDLPTSQQRRYHFDIVLQLLDVLEHPHHHNIDSLVDRTATALADHNRKSSQLRGFLNRYATRISPGPAADLAQGTAASYICDAADNPDQLAAPFVMRVHQAALDTDESRTQRQQAATWLDDPNVYLDLAADPHDEHLARWATQQLDGLDIDRNRADSARVVCALTHGPDPTVGVTLRHRPDLSDHISVHTTTDNQWTVVRHGSWKVINLPPDHPDIAAFLDAHRPRGYLTDMNAWNRFKNLNPADAHTLRDARTHIAQHTATAA